MRAFFWVAYLFGTVSGMFGLTVGIDHGIVGLIVASSLLLAGNFPPIARAYWGAE